MAMSNSYTGDNTGKVTSMTYPSGKVSTITYSQGRTNAMTLNAAPLISGIQYFPFGGPESWLLGAANSAKEYTRIIDQSSRTQQYDPKVVPLRDTTPSGFRTIQYDNASRIVGINNYTGATLNGSQTFTYDNAGRLTTFSGYTSNGVNATTGLGNAAITQTQSFAYDNNGNRTSSTLNSIASTYSYQSGNNRLASVTGGIIKTNSYDATGNLTNDGAQTYTYDARGRLTGANVPANSTAPTTNYLINYQGLRVKKANANTAITTSNRTFIYDDGGKMLGEYDHAGNPVQELIWLGDTPIAVTGTMLCLTSTTGANGTPTCTEAATAYIFTDHLNTPREVAGINSTTNAYVSLWKWDSLPFGETLPNENPSSTGIFSFNHRFPGQYRDKETGLSQNWFRDFDAGLGRYVTSDPKGLNAGTNTYLYSNGDPALNKDPTGLETYQCSRKLNNVPFRAGPLYHQFICIGNSSTRFMCGGLGPTGSMFNSPGMIEMDDFKAETCTKVADDNQCVESCIAKAFVSAAPNYSVDLSKGENCQTWAAATFGECSAKCKYGKK